MHNGSRRARGKSTNSKEDGSQPRDVQNQRIAILKLIVEKFGESRRAEIEPYKLYATSSEFKTALNQGVTRVMQEPATYGINAPAPPA